MQRFRACESSRQVATAATTALRVVLGAYHSPLGGVGLNGVTRMRWCARWEKHNWEGGLLLPVPAQPFTFTLARQWASQMCTCQRAIPFRCRCQSPVSCSHGTPQTPSDHLVSSPGHHVITDNYLYAVPASGDSSSVFPVSKSPSMAQRLFPGAHTFRV